MAKKASNELAERPTSDMAVPEYLRDETGLVEGAEDLAKFIIPPRLKVVQKSASTELLDRFGMGVTILQPPGVELVGRDAPFYFTPLLFFPEWCVWNPLGMKGTLPAIRERTFDAKSKAAEKSRVPKLRYEPCPEDPEQSIRYVEHLNFLVLLRKPDQFTGTMAIMSFSRAEHKAGSSFAQLVKMRKAHIYGCNFEARVSLRSNAKGEWYGFDVSNPAGDSGVSAWAGQDEIEALRAMHLEHKKNLEEAKLRVDYGDDLDDDEPAADDM